MPQSSPRPPRERARPDAARAAAEATAPPARSQFLEPITAPDFRAPWASDERGEIVNAERAKIREKAGEAIWQAIKRKAPLQAAADAAGLAAALEFAEPKLHAGFLSLFAAREREGLPFAPAEALEDLLFLLGAPPLDFFGAFWEPGSDVFSEPSSAPLSDAFLEESAGASPLGPFLSLSPLENAPEASAASDSGRAHAAKKWPLASRAQRTARSFSGHKSPARGATLLDLPDVARLGVLAGGLRTHLTQSARSRPPSDESAQPLLGVTGHGLLDFSLGPLLSVFCAFLLLNPNGPWASLLRSAQNEEKRQDLALAWIWMRLRLTSAAARLSAPERRLDAASSMADFLRGEEPALGFSPELLSRAETHFFCVQSWLHFEQCEASDPGASPGKPQTRVFSQPVASDKAARAWDQIASRGGQDQWGRFLLDRFDGTLASARFGAMSWAGASEFMEALPDIGHKWSDALAQKSIALAPDEAAQAFRRALAKPAQRNLLETLAQCRRHANAKIDSDGREPRFEDDRDAAINAEPAFCPARLTREWAKRRLIDPRLAPGSILGTRAANWRPIDNLFEAWIDAIAAWRPDEQKLVDGFNPRAAQEAFFSALWMGPSWANELIERAPFLIESLAQRERPHWIGEFNVWAQTLRGEPEISSCAPVLTGRARLAVFPVDAAILFGAEPIARALRAANSREPSARPFVELVEWAQASGPQGLGVLRWAQGAHARFEAFELGGKFSGKSSSSSGAARSPKRL